MDHLGATQPLNLSQHWRDAREQRLGLVAGKVV
jgi:hypothetical protein